ncbi:MAG: hypothetical protein RLY43_2373 [Bacteroidota bacterium]|jgi:hypothetical protein
MINKKIDKMNYWDQTWFKLIGSCFFVGSVVASILIFYFQNHESDIEKRYQDKIEFQQKECERDNEERMLKLKLEIQSEYFVQPASNSPTAKKMEEVFNRIDKRKNK